MKVLGIFLSVYLLNLGFVYIVDMMAGLKFSRSLKNMAEPFLSMTFPEYVIVIILLSMMFVPYIVSYFKQRK
ncbi:hypothetical protein KZ483_07375 [Paenibacillus sp. sptzw28]|uniref:hypothetical protein n=1 Tax=Paenibacillus sp. sptzw28 TaxID=715179 RepID=UPI001C6E1D2F|nr:hypothetical protein [Paenibacillus sp. sptzw28]QYR22755.1 hypothetical protein KZ483_07375 [Paenibacillus sp. sptzw28]